MKLQAILLSALCLSAFGAEADMQKQKAAAGELKKTLGGELKAKLGDGAANAVEFCSKNALTITDSVAKKHSLNIKRVSEKNRNAKNTPDATDKKAIEMFAAQMANGAKPIDNIVVDGRYYEPMLIGEMCIVCHGKEGSIAKDTAEKIKQAYPSDKAVGYNLGELRGVIAVW